MPNGFVYLWTNKVNGKRYIGSHMGTVDDGYVGSGSVFLRAVKKYGLESFERIILENVENVDRKGLEAREQHYLDLHDAAASKDFYNLRATAGGGWEHVNSCPVLKEANRRRSLGNTWGSVHKGRTGRPLSEEEKEIRRKASKTWMMENVARPVHRFNFDGTLDRSYLCIQEAAKDVKTSPSNILYAAQGKFKQIAGWRWSFENVPLEPLDRISTMGKKSVHTPLGVYEKVVDVVAAFGFSSTNQVRRRCISNDPKWSEWYYVFNKE